MAGLLAGFQVSISIPEGASATVLIVLRWIHFLAGITWIGLLYFFNLVNIPFLRELDPPTRARVVPPLMSRAMWWFRWASVVTVLAGIGYWMNIVSSDAHNANAGAGRAIGSFFVLWTVAVVIEIGALMSPAKPLHRGLPFSILTTVLVCAAAYGYLILNSHGWESNRLLAIGIGGGIGWFMMFNVWGIVWRVQKKVIRHTAGNPGAPLPPELQRMAGLALLATRVNFVLSFPLLFFMGVASHYPIFGNIPTP